MHRPQLQCSTTVRGMELSDTDMFQQKFSVEGRTGMAIQFWLIRQRKFRLYVQSKSSNETLRLILLRSDNDYTVFAKQNRKVLTCFWLDQSLTVPGLVKQWTSTTGTRCIFQMPAAWTWNFELGTWGGTKVRTTVLSSWAIQISGCAEVWIPKTLMKFSLSWTFLLIWFRSTHEYSFFRNLSDNLCLFRYCT